MPTPDLARAGRRAAAVLTAGGLGLLAACGGAADGATASGDAVAVAAEDDSCQVATTELPAGTHTFRVTNSGSQVTEFYVYADGDRVVGEVENIAPGVSRELLVALAEGSYQATCKPGMVGDGIRSTLTVTAAADAPTQAAADPLLAGAGAAYQQYVRQQTADLLTRTTAFVDAVKAGDVAQAKALYAAARLPWERIEPVAESFGDLDPRIDAREGDQEEGEDFTGFHRIEQALWQTGDVSATGPYADQLLADVQEIVTQADQVTLEPLQLANGAKALLDEIATGKITGEEERYSHTDLWDLAGNLEGSQAAIEQLRPYLEAHDADLAAELAQRFAATTAELDAFRSGDGYVLYDSLTEDQLRGLSDSVTALTESVSRVPAAVASR